MKKLHQGLSGAARGFAMLGLCLPLATMASGATAGALSHGVVHVVRHAGGAVNTNQSSNWSGYNIGADYPQVTTGTLFTSISGQWTVPKATQHTSGQAEDSATWIGIGGGCVNDDCDVSDDTLIQAGTEQDVNKKGKASYGAWWEIIPETETAVTLAVSAGNKIAVSINETSTPGDWSIVIKNLTTHKQFSTTQEYSSSEDTVEWIEETPLEIGTTGTGIAAMPNLSTVHFVDATYNGANPKFQTIDEMQLDNSSMIEATPSAPGPNLNSFNDCTWASHCAAP
jgi:Peptidase A4 family